MSSYSSFLRTLGNPVAFYPGLVKPLGSVNAVLFFCQIYYWQDKTDNELGVYKSSDDIEAETGLTYREQSTARKQLVDRGVLVETNKRLEHRIYYRIDREALEALLAECVSCNSPNALYAVRGVRFPQFDPTETTSKTTLKDISVDAAASQCAADAPHSHESRKASARPAIDYQAIADAYNEILGSRLPKVASLNDKRKRQIRALNSQLREPTLDCWRTYFEAFNEEAKPFYFGDNSRAWVANFDYLLRTDTLTKIREGAL